MKEHSLYAIKPTLIIFAKYLTFILEILNTVGMYNEIISTIPFKRDDFRV